LITSYIITDCSAIRYDLCVTMRAEPRHEIGPIPSECCGLVITLSFSRTPMTNLRTTLLLFTAMLGMSLAGLHAGEAKTGFLNKVYKGKDGDVKYIVFVPKDYTGDKEYPVILFLHGAGESGTDGKT